MGADLYHLVDVHWHTPSEHTVGGVVFPMEQHMKYKRVSAEGGPNAAAQGSAYTVVSAFVHPGQANDPLDRLLASARRADPSESWEIPEAALDALLPTCTESYRYIGSTTVYPYILGVRWNVLTHPVQASAEAMRHYRTVFPTGNAREVRGLGDRRVLSDRHRWW
ncbi:carbonic anhydrase family protein [Streptomyces sp. NPDC002643]